MSRFTLEEYTDEEKRENGNMMKFGKLHDKICAYLEKEYILKDSQVNDISMGVWLAIESLSPYKEFVEQQQSKLKAQQEVIDRLEKENKELKECAEFYGNPENWITRRESSWDKTDPRRHGDSELILGYRHPNTEWIGSVTVGGKRAREALAKMEAK